jgi:uncharacterized protein
MDTITPEQLDFLRWTYLLGVFCTTALFGWVAERSHFCTMGAIQDVVAYGNWSRAIQWSLAISMAGCAFALLVWFGQINPQNTLYASKKWTWLSAGFGGLLFGCGMVLASGCSGKNLIRAATGSLKAWLVLLVMAVSALATMRGLPAVWRVGVLEPVFLDVPMGASLWEWIAHGFAGSPTAVLLCLACAVLLLVFSWAWKSRAVLETHVLTSGLALGLLVGVLWWLGGSYAHIAEHPETLEEIYIGTRSGRIEALSLTAPIADWLDAWMYYSDNTKQINSAMVAVIGIMAGAACSAWSNGGLRWQGFADSADTLRHVLGAVLMGLGGITAMGCTIGQGLSGLSTYSLNSVLALIGMTVGAAFTIRLQMRRIERQAL